MKRLVSLLVIMCMLIGSVPALAEEVDSTEELYLNVELKRYSGDSLSYDIIFDTNCPEVYQDVYYPDGTQRGKTSTYFGSVLEVGGLYCSDGSYWDYDGEYLMVFRYGDLKVELIYTIENSDRYKAWFERVYGFKPETKEPESTEKPNTGGSSVKVGVIGVSESEIELYTGDVKEITVVSSKSVTVEVEDESVVKAELSNGVLSIKALKMGESEIWLRNSDTYIPVSVTVVYGTDPSKQQETVIEELQYPREINVVKSLGIMQGYDDGTFKPEGTLTRAEAAAIIVRLLNLENEIEQGQTNFIDMPATHWASGYVNFAEANGIVNGQGDGTFAPDEFVTNNQFLKMLVCTLGYEPMAMANGGWNYGGYITAAEEIGLVEKEPENKNEPITRGEAALICYRALDIDFMVETWYNCTGMGASAFEIAVGETILTKYWGMEYEFVREFYFEKTFGFELPEGAKSVDGEYWVENNGDEKCYMGKIRFDKKDLDYIKENLEKQDFADGVLVEDSDVVYSGKHDRDAHLNWWDAGNYGTQKAHYHWIKEDETVRYIHAVEFEAFVIEDSDGTYWLYVYKFDAEDVNI